MTTDTPCPNCGAAVAQGARFCASCGMALGPGAAAASAEERKVATILFADVIGSTDLGEQLDPERLRALLQEYFAAMSRVIEQWAGTVEKYIGDAILAVFGVPTAREDDAVRALHAATEMLAQIERLNDDFEARHGVRVQVRIGVNTGEVLAPVGARAGGQFLVSGDPVNVASRRQEAAEPGSILVGERTWTAARNVFAFGEPISLPVKGKRDPVMARRLGPRTGDESRGVRFQAPMVGRERELDTLLGLLDEAMETEQPGLVVVSGSAGIGKSRMLREFVGAANERHEDLVVLRGRCLAAGHGITFWALGEILRAACGISLDEPADRAVEKLRRTVTTLLEPLGVRQNELDETFHALATSANLPVAGNPLDQIEPEGVGEEMARAWPRFLTGLAASKPTVIILEDLHWADERMVGMIESLATRSSGQLMVLGTARPEFLESHSGFASGGDITLVALRPLTEGQSERLVTELLGDSDPLKALLMDVRQKADGNPFFLEEILQRLIDEGALVRHEGRWQATELAQTVRLPDTIHALLAARIDALPAAEKTLLQQAAVVGRIFWPGSLGAAVDGSDPVDVLRALERRGLVSARPSSTIEGQPEYIFRHVLIRDVAYTSVPKARRARAHAETGRWLEELAADRLEEFGELLAYHYAAAAAGEDADLAWATEPAEREVVRQRAFEALLSSGAAALRRFAVDRAVALHEQALVLAANDGERARAQEASGDDHEALFHMDEAAAFYLQAVDSFRATDDGAEAIGRIASKLAATARRWGAFKAEPPHRQTRELVQESLKRDVSERLRAELMISAAALGDYRPRSSSKTPLSGTERSAIPRYVALAEEGLALAQRMDDSVLIHRAYHVLEVLHWHARDIAAYRAVNDQLMAIVERLPSRREKVDAISAAAGSRAEAGRYAEALEAAEKAAELSSELSAHERMHATFYVMVAAEMVGDWDRVVDVLPWHATAAADEGDVNCPNVRGGGPLGAIVLIRRGEAGRAAELVPIDEGAAARDTLYDRALIARYALLSGRRDIATAIADSMGADPDRAVYPDGFEIFIETLFDLGRRADVERFLPAARELTPALAILGPTADRIDARLAIADGDLDRARSLLESSVAGFVDLAIPFEIAQTQELLATLVDDPRRTDLLRSAAERYEGLGAKPSIERVRSMLAA
ncbi:MAG: AAA family ATPase [Candidatus Limnocylindrales bacterium]